MEELLRMCGGMEHIVHEQNLELRRLQHVLGNLQTTEHDPQAVERKRASLLQEIGKYGESIENLQVSLAKAQRLMLSTLSDEERNVVKLRCFHRYRWNVVARKAAMCRSKCCKVYVKSLDKMCDAWK